LAWPSFTRSILFCRIRMCFSFMISIAARCSEVWGWGQDSLPAENRSHTNLFTWNTVPFLLPPPKMLYKYYINILNTFRYWIYTRDISTGTNLIICNSSALITKILLRNVTINYELRLSIYSSL
jgi:hypothetical protein